MSRANVVDSSAWLEYFAGTRAARHFAHAIEDTAHLVVPVITIYEVFRKVRRERGDDDALQVVAAMLHGAIVDIDVPLAIEAGQLNLPLADSLVYATAQRHEATLWTQDADFDGLPGVKYFARD
ncbi:MAG: type II toxin-antitoxin system VapC family toxin [Vicinamibacterales bacterium]